MNLKTFLELCNNFIVEQKKLEADDHLVNNTKLDILYRYINRKAYK